jgi:hypothetical protein
MKFSARQVQAEWARFTARGTRDWSGLQAQMETDFLILVVSRTNSVVQDQSRSGWLRIALLLARLHRAALRPSPFN